MAFLGSLGKTLGLGTTRSVVSSVTGSPILGNIAGGVSETIGRIGDTVTGTTEQGQATAIARDSFGAQENQFSSAQGANMINAAFTGAGANFASGFNRAFQAAQVAQRPPAMQQANLPAIIGAGRNMQALGQMLLGGVVGAAPMIIDALTGEPKKLIVTRRLKSQVRKAVELIGLEATADAMGVSTDIVVFIMTKKMRNDGAYVTKAAVRKTRQTVRKMKTLCDMYDDLRPPARRRASPVRKSTSITQVK